MASPTGSYSSRPETPRIEVTETYMPDSTADLLDRKDAFSLPGVDNPVFCFDDIDGMSVSHELSYLNDDTLSEYEGFGRRGSITSITRPQYDMDSLAVPYGLRSRRGSNSSTQSQDSLTDQKKPKTLTTDVGNSSLATNLLSPAALSVNSAWTELSGREFDQYSMGSSLFSSNTLSNVSNLSSSLSVRLHDLRRAFSSRTERLKMELSQPPSPSLASLQSFRSCISVASQADSLLKLPQKRLRLGSFVPAMSHTSDNVVEDTWVEVGRHRWRKPKWLRKLTFPNTIQPQSKLYLFWLGFVAFAFIYNTVTLPLRVVFPYQREENLHVWLTLDYTCDFLYIVDIIFFKPRIRFNNNGVIETKREITRKNYIISKAFKFDIISLLPLDFFYFVTGVNAWLRIPRIFKIHAFWEFFERCDQAVRSGFALRISKTVIYMLLLIHVEACGYYAASVYEGIGSNRWVYSGEGNAYIRCFYLAVKTATSIGNNPKPTNVFEYIFMTIYWLSGVFVFALLIGQIRDIVDSVGKIRNEHRKRVDDVLHYMKRIDLPKPLQERVRTWFNYCWEQQKALNEETVMDILPRAIKTDLSISVNFQTLNKVQIFQDCDKNLLFALVLKLKPVLYLPDDYICRKGEVGKEMYIVSQGVVDVLGGKDSKSILATLREGSVFGEISLLGLSSGGGNRRTADIRCRGYTNLFILSKSNFEQAMKDYPEAHKLLKHKAKKLLKMNAKFEDKEPEKRCEDIIKTPPETPKLIKTAIKIMQVRSGSKYVPLFKSDKQSKDSEETPPDMDDTTNLIHPNAEQEPEEMLQITKTEESTEENIEENTEIKIVQNTDQIKEENVEQELDEVYQIVVTKTEQEIEEDEILASAERYEQLKRSNQDNDGTIEERNKGMDTGLTDTNIKEQKMSVTSDEINEIMKAAEDDANQPLFTEDMFRTDTISVTDKQKYKRNQSITSEEINDILQQETIETMERKSVTSEEINDVFKSEPIMVQPVTPVIEHPTDVSKPPGIAIELVPHSKPKLLQRNQFTLAAEIHHNHSKNDFWADEKISYSKPTAKVLPLVKISTDSPIKSDSDVCDLITNSGDFQTAVSCEDLKSKETEV